MARDQEARLHEFGLSEYAARAYLALLRLGTSEARPISRLARVPIAKVYSTLDQLAERGLCTIEPGPPKRFSPVPIQAFLDQLVSHHHTQARVLAERKDDLARFFPIAPMPHADDRGIFQVLRGRRVVLDRMRQLYGAAQSGVLHRAADQVLARRAVLAPLWRDAHMRGVRVRLLARVGVDALEGLSEVAHACDVRAKGTVASNVAVCVFDGKAALVLHFLPDDGSTTRGQDVALFTTEEAMVGAITGFLEGEWERAERFDVARARVERGEAAPSTRLLPASELDARVRRLLEEEPGDVLHAMGGAPSSLAGIAHALAVPAAKGFATRVLVRVEDLVEQALAERLARELPEAELRHDASAGVGGIVVGSGAFVGLRAAPGHDAPDVLESTDTRLVAALRSELDARWSRATRLQARRAELERAS